MKKRTFASWAALAALVLWLPACGGGGDSGGDDYTDRMSAEHADDQPVAGAASGAGEAANVDASNVEYGTLDDKALGGYLARPSGEAGVNAPGVIVIHEWWGLNDNVRAMTRELAAQGYAALAVDLYGGEVAEDPAAARELMSASTERESELEANLKMAYEYLAGKAGAPRVGVIGWCFGGGWSLRTALLVPERIDAVVMYYGRVITDREQLAALRAPLLGIFGAEDQGIPVQGVREFESLLAELGKDAEIHVYEGAGHAFANPSGTRYVKEAADDAWGKTLAFFGEHLRTP